MDSSAALKALNNTQTHPEPAAEHRRPGREKHTPRVFFTSSMSTSFIMEDIALLKRHFRVEVSIGSGPGAVLRILRGVRRTDVAFCWFGSVYAAAMIFAARLAGKPSVVILGGVDTAREPSLGYGIWLTRWKAALLRRALPLADRLFVVDASLKRSLQEASGWDAAGVTVLPTGYDPDFWNPSGTKRRMVLCVAGCDNLQRVAIKGVDLLLKAAARMPQTSFRIIGIARSLDAVYAEAPPNVEILPPLPRPELLVHYQEAAVYCQPSRREGLPNTLCEAMLCGCIPAGTRAGGIPTAIGDCGPIADPDNVDALVAALEQALAMPEEAGMKARQHIATSFPRWKREESLVETINILAHAKAFD